MSNDPVITVNPDDDGTGYVATYQDAGREYEITYDENFVFESETVTKLYDDVKALDATAASFQKAWGLIKDDLLPGVLAADSEGTTEADLLFAIVDTYQTVVLGNNNAVLMRVNSWEGSDQWEGWDGNTYLNKDTNYNFHAPDWEHLGNAGTNERYIVVSGGDDILDEEGTHVGFSTENTTSISSALTSYADALNTHLSITDIAQVARIQSQDSQWSGLAHSQRPAGFQEWTDNNERIELFDSTETFKGSLEFRDGFIEIRNANWETVARLLDGGGLTIDELVAAYPEHDGFADAWLALKDYMPAEFQPAVAGSESTLKFQVDDWGDILVFDANGSMVGRSHSWEHDGTWTRYIDGEQYTITNSMKGYNFNDADWNDIGRYEEGARNFTHKEGVALASEDQYKDETTTFTSYAIEKPDAGGDMTAWDAAEQNFYLPLVPNDQVATIEGATGLNASWADFSKISVGLETVTTLQNFNRDSSDTFTNKRIEYFKEAGSGQNTYDEFVGSVEIRDGFIEVRDSSWNEIFRGRDVSNAKTVADIDATHDGFAEAWNEVKTYLPTELQADTVRFTSDEWHIYAFSAAGTLLSNIGFWNSEHTFTNWDGKEYRTVDTHYNFNGSDWSPLANSGSYQRFVVDTDGTEYLDETGSHSGYTVTGTALATALGELNSGVEGLFSGVTFATDVAMARLDKGSWQGLDHDLRDDYFEPWDDTNTSIELYTDATDPGSRIGRVETRDGFVEVYDSTWTLLGRLLDGNGLSAADVDVIYAGFSTALGKVAQFVPSDWGTLSDLKFTVDDWDNVVVFNASGDMVGRVNVWEFTDTWDRYHDGDQYEVENTSVSFNFNDDNWNDIGRYEDSTMNIISKNGTTLDTPILDETREYTSYAITDDNAGFATELAKYDILSLVDASQAALLENDLGAAMADVMQITVGTNEIVRSQNELRESQETTSEGRIEFFTWHGNPDRSDGWPEFVASMETRGGFIEIRNKNWDVVGKVADPDSLLTLDQIKGDFAGFEQAWNEVGSNLPDFASAADVKFSADDWHIYAFADGALKSTINFWNGEHTWTGWDGVEFYSEDTNYNFHDDQWNHLGNYGTNSRFIVESDGTKVAFETDVYQGYNIEGPAAQYFLVEMPLTDIGTADAGLYAIDTTNHIAQPVAEDASGAFVADGSPISLTSALDASYYSGLPGDTLGVDGNSLPVYDIQPLFPAGIADLFDDATYLNSVSMIRVEQSEINGLRARNPQEDPNFQPWDEEFVSYELFQPDLSTTDTNDVERIARVEIRDGLVEVFDGNWQKVGNLLGGDGMDPGAIVALFPGFDVAWDKVSTFLPDEFTPDIDGGEMALKFNLDEYNNILVYTGGGQLIGTANVFTNTHTWDNYSHQDGSMYTIEETVNMFNFHNADWSPVGSYETREGVIVAKDGVQLSEAEQMDFEETERVSYSIMKEKDDGAETYNDWNALEASLGFPTTVSASDLVTMGFSDPFVWETELDMLNVSQETREVYDSPLQSAKGPNTYKNIEYFKNTTENGHTYPKLMGVLEEGDGFIELRDANWAPVTEVVDPSSFKTFAEISGDYTELDTAWTKVASYLPSGIADPAAATVKFTSDGRNLFVIDEADGNKMYEIFVNQNQPMTFENVDGSQNITTFFGFEFETDTGEFLAGYFGDKTVNKVGTTETVMQEFEGIQYTVTETTAADAQAWADLNPNTSKFNWSDIDFVKYSKGTFTDNVSGHSNVNEMIEYFITKTENSVTFDEHVATLDVMGSQTTLWDESVSPRELIYSRMTGGSEEPLAVKMANDPMTATAFTYFTTEIEGKLGSLDSINVTMDPTTPPAGSATPQASVTHTQPGDTSNASTMKTGTLTDINGTPIGYIRMEEWDNSSTEKGWDISFSDLNHEDMFAVGGHIDVNSDGNYVSTRDVRFSDYVDVAGLSAAELTTLKAKYSAMDGATGFVWDEVGILRETVEVDNPGAADENKTDRTDFIKIDAAGYRDYDYFKYENESGLVIISQGPTETVVSTSFSPAANQQTIVNVFPIFDAVAAKVAANHGSTIQQYIPEDLSSLTFNMVGSEEFVATDAGGNVKYLGYVSHNTLSADSSANWRMTLETVSYDWIVKIGGTNETNASAEFVATGAAKTYVAERFYNDDPNWPTLISQYTSISELALAIPNAVAMEVYTVKKDTDGSGTYVDDIIEVRFAPDSYGEPDWDWDTNYSVQISGGNPIPLAGGATYYDNLPGTGTVVGIYTPDAAGATAIPVYELGTSHLADVTTEGLYAVDVTNNTAQLVTGNGFQGFSAAISYKAYQGSTSLGSGTAPANGTGVTDPSMGIPVYELGTSHLADVTTEGLYAVDVTNNTAQKVNGNHWQGFSTEGAPITLAGGAAYYDNLPGIQTVVGLYTSTPMTATGIPVYELGTSSLADISTEGVYAVDTSNNKAQLVTGNAFQGFTAVGNPIDLNGSNATDYYDSFLMNPTVIGLYTPPASDSGSHSAQVVNVVVKVVDDGGLKFSIDDNVVTSFKLTEGTTYEFDQSDGSNATHRLLFSTSADGSSPYTEGVVVSSEAPGTQGAKTTITVADNAPDLFTYCELHGATMGFDVTTESPGLPVYDLAGSEFSEITSSGIYAIDELNHTAQKLSGTSPNFSADGASIDLASDTNYTTALTGKQPIGDYTPPAASVTNTTVDYSNYTVKLEVDADDLLDLKDDDVSVQGLAIVPPNAQTSEYGAIKTGAYTQARDYSAVYGVNEYYAVPAVDAQNNPIYVDGNGSVVNQGGEQAYYLLIDRNTPPDTSSPISESAYLLDGSQKVIGFPILSASGTHITDNNGIPKFGNPADVDWTDPSNLMDIGPELKLYSTAIDLSTIFGTFNAGTVSYRMADAILNWQSVIDNMEAAATAGGVNSALDLDVEAGEVINRSETDKVIDFDIDSIADYKAIVSDNFTQLAYDPTGYNYWGRPAFEVDGVTQKTDGDGNKLYYVFDGSIPAGTPSESDYKTDSMHGNKILATARETFDGNNTPTPISDGQGNTLLNYDSHSGGYTTYYDNVVQAFEQDGTPIVDWFGNDMYFVLNFGADPTSLSESDYKLISGTTDKLMAVKSYQLDGTPLVNKYNSDVQLYEEPQPVYYGTPATNPDNSSMTDENGNTIYWLLEYGTDLNNISESDYVTDYYDGSKMFGVPLMNGSNQVTDQNNKAIYVEMESHHHDEALVFGSSDGKTIIALHDTEDLTAQEIDDVLDLILYDPNQTTFADII